MCVSVIFLMKAILSFFDFWTIFCCFDFSFHFCFDLPQVSNSKKAILSKIDFWIIFFLIFLFIFALTFHKCQIVMKAILSFYDFWTIFLFFFLFSFHFCFDFPQVSNCEESDSFIFIFGPFFKVLFFLFIFALTFHKCQIVKKAILSFFDF